MPGLSLAAISGRLNSKIEHRFCYKLEAMSGSPNSLPSLAPLNVLDQSPDVSYVVSEQLDIVYCNPAWDRFAGEQGGSALVMAENVLGRNLLDFVPRRLKRFYLELFAQARELGQPVGHDYECSSASVFRLYRLQVYPLQRGAGFVVQNSLRLERPHDRTPLERDDALYADSKGIIHACANCRRTQRAANPAIWDWVPAYIESRGLNISHGICPMCLEFYYRPAIKKYSAA